MNETQLKTISEVKSLGGMDKIEEVFRKVSEQEICIVGEPIIDTYKFCNPENLSSKFPAISANYQYEEDYLGGSLAIANHLSDFVKSTALIITSGHEDYFIRLLAEKMDKRVALFNHGLTKIPTPRKVRYIAVDRGQRIFEITYLKSNQWDTNSPEVICQTIRTFSKLNGPMILADFGHGFFEQKVLQELKNIEGFIALNVQTNSSNYGFNVFKKHLLYDYLTLDIKEARLAYNDRYSDASKLCENIGLDLNENQAFSMTLGANGSCYQGKEGRMISCPSFAENIVDATGAGDAYFGLTSLLEYAECPAELIPFIGNVFAGLKTKIMGNKTAVTKAQLFSKLQTILTKEL